jgi:DNA-binding beta-propeller fold protein YncE
MRASLSPRMREVREALPLLEPRGARVVLGAQVAAPVAPIVPSASSLFGPRGACLASSAGPLLVCDTGHHRLLIWKAVPGSDGVPADLVIGQPDFSAEGRNARRETGAATLNVPTGISVSADVLAVADAWNHRVLLWYGMPCRPNQPADVVLGQKDFRSGLANRGEGATRVDTLNWPYGVLIHERCLYVADTGNRRILVWHSLPETNGTPADLVLDEGMRWPHGIAANEDHLFVADAGSSRLFVWRNLVFVGGRGEDINMPYGVTVQHDRVVVADTANSRLLGFDFATGTPRWLAGQKTLNDKGDNRWGFAARDSLCWPQGVAACGDTLVVADSGNHRILLWEIA